VHQEKLKLRTSQLDRILNHQTWRVFSMMLRLLLYLLIQLQLFIIILWCVGLAHDAYN